MNNFLSLCRRRFPAYCLAAVVLALVAISDAAAQGKGKNVASKIYVTDLQGEADIATNDKIVELKKKSAYLAQGAVIETKKPADPEEKTYASVVYSNGTGIVLGPDTRLEVKKFTQEQFTPNRSDLEAEPSVSQTQTFLARGLICLCTSTQVAGSSMVYQTPHGSVNIRGQKIVLETTDEYTRIAMIEGECTVRGGTGSRLDAGGLTLHSGDQTYLRQDAAGHILPFQVERIPPNELGSLEDKIAMACLAKKTVYFEIAKRPAGNGDTTTGPVTAFDGNDGLDDELVPIEVVPATLPVQFNVSPAKLGSG
jgi:hypothetical protein